MRRISTRLARSSAPVLFLLAVLAGNLGLAPIQSQPPASSPPCAGAPPGGVPPGVVHVPDVTYRRPDDKTRLELDLAYPKDGNGPFPCVICIHGGGWLRGSRKSHVPLICELASQGYVAAAVSYRFAPECTFPAQFHDVQDAVRWLRENARKYKIDKERIAALGYSSGGNLACLLGMGCAQDELTAKGDAHKESSRVQAVVSYSGLMDLSQMHQCCVNGELPFLERKLITLSLECYLGGSPDKAPCAYIKASPMTFATKNTAPTLLVHGGADTLVPMEQSKMLEKKLRAAGAEVNLVSVEKAFHDFTPAQEKEARKAVFQFLKTTFKAKKGD